MADLSYAQERTLESLNRATVDMQAVVQQALATNGLGPKSPEAKAIAAELEKIKGHTVNEMLKDRSKKKSLKEFG